MGGVLQVENPYIAKAEIKRLRRYVPVSKNHLSGSIPTEMLWDTDLTYAPVLEPVSYTHLDVYKRQALDGVVLGNGLVVQQARDGASFQQVLVHDLFNVLFLDLSLIHI